MAIPTTRDEFASYCLRRIGAPVNCINVDPEQIDDRIDDALQYFRDYHFDGTQRMLLKHAVTQDNIDNEYIDFTADQQITGVTRIFDIGDATQTSNLFNIRYQIHLNDLFDISASSMLPYVMSMTHVRLLEEIFVGKKAIRYNRHENRLYIDMAWQNDITPGEIIIIDCYVVMDPDTYPDVWSDRFLQRYATQLIKKQWGENMKKYGGVQLPGGVELNGQQIYEEAHAELEKLEDEMINSYSLPAWDFTG